MVKIRQVVIKSLMLLSLCSCGVRGDPMPPKTPPDLGRGKPSYKGATESLAYPIVPSIEKLDNQEDRPEPNEEDL